MEISCNCTDKKIAVPVCRLLILEPFYGGSHKQLIDVIKQTFTEDNFQDYDLFTLPAKKWPWKARCSALHFSEAIPKTVRYRMLFCSSVLNLSELLGMRTDLSVCHKVVYFHENQLVYPVQKTEGGDYQFGYNQITTAIAADEVYFNSEYNLRSFCDHLKSFLNRIPDHKPTSILDIIKPKCRVLYFPINFADIRLPTKPTLNPENMILHIVWAHRWEHDKDPDSFFRVLLELQNNGFNFRVSVLGQVFSETPKVFTESKRLIESSVMNWGYVQSKSKYYEVLQSADVAVSTAIHEFFGVSIMECTYCGCFPLCPNRLSYPELYPTECLYNTSRQLYKRLREYCVKPWLAAQHRKRLEIDFKRYSWEERKCDYLSILQANKKKSS